MSHTSKVHNRVLYQFCVVCFCAAVSLLGFSASEAWALTNVSAPTVSYSESELPIDCVASAHTSKYPVVAGLDCASCHGVLEGISSPKLHKSCATCHGADVSDKVKAAVAAGDTNCATCHGAIHADVNELHAQPYPDLGLDCASCHGAASSLMDKNLHGGCVICHGPNAPANVKAAVASGDANCQTCHTDIHTGVGSFHRSSYPDVAGLDCVSCHGESFAVSDTSLHSSCNMCHSSNASATVKTAVTTGNKACTACHGTIHANVDSTHTAIYPEVQGLDCASCHGEGTAISATKLHSNCGLCHGSNVSSTVKAAVAAGNRNCSACHSNIHADLDGAHASAFPEVSGLDCASCHGAASTLSATTLHKNCNLCHGADASDKVKDAVANGKTDCASCHGEIHSNVDGAHASAFPEVSGLDCASCHGSSSVLSATTLHKNCNLCHGADASDKVKDAVANGKTDCASCHGEIHSNVDGAHASAFPEVSGLDCASCHGEVSGVSDTKLHKSCATCHGADVSDKVKAAVAAGDTNCATCHGEIHSNVDGAHAQTYPSISGLDCASCHGAASTLSATTLHKNCNLCHGADASDKVKDAVANGKTDCASCHGEIHSNVDGAHASAFPEVSGLDCASCHGAASTLSATTLHKNCNLCHGADASDKVKDAVANGKTDCASCHGEIHSNVDGAHKAPAVYQNVCGRCHGTTLIGKGSGYRGLGSAHTCRACHSSKNELVKKAILNGDTSCTSCHPNHHMMWKLSENGWGGSSSGSGWGGSSSGSGWGGSSWGGSSWGGSSWGGSR